MRNPPPEVLRSWPTPNYTDPVTKGNTLAIVGIILMLISILVVVARLYCRHFVLHNIGTDDVLVAVSLFPMIALTASTMLGVKYGWGRHLWDVKPEMEVQLLLYSWISQLLFVLAVTFSKLSIVWAYARLSPSVLFKRTLIGSGAFIILYGLAFTLAVIFRCRPINAYWSSDPNHRAGCFEENEPLIISSAINIFIDIWLVILPIPILWKLQLPTRQRVILIILMSLGILVCCASVVRIYFLIETLLKTYDVTWEGYTVWLWTSVEIQLGIITTSIPPLRPLVRLYFPHILGKGSVSSKAGLSAAHTSVHIPGFQMVTGPTGENTHHKSTLSPYEQSARSESTEHLQDRERDLQRQSQTGKGYTSPV